MSKSHRPRTLDERAEVCAAILAYPLRPDADPLVVTVLARTLLPAAEAWSTTRDTWVSADAAYNAAVGELETADAAFDAALDALSWSVKDPSGRPGALTELLQGHSVSDVRAMRAAREVALGSECLQRLPTSGLGYDAAAASTLAAAVEALSAANTAVTAASGACVTSRAQLTELEPALDTSCSKAYTSVKAVAPAVAEALFPVFVRGGSGAAK